jgi:hypothetical protein
LVGHSGATSAAACIISTRLLSPIGARTTNTWLGTGPRTGLTATVTRALRKPKTKSDPETVAYAIFILSVVLLCLAAAIFRRQSGATSCPTHSHLAGKIATVLAWVSLVMGVAVAGYALLLSAT